MTGRAPAKDWQPQGGIVLEPAALAVATSKKSFSVVAGPGAGKTELLAQRACYLLQTRTCQPPQRILAISFKRDAARTLRERVARRAGERSANFESYTFDGFAKSILDRFLVCVPAYRSPRADYRIAPWLKRDVEEFLRALRPPKELGSTHDLVGLDGAAFMRDVVVGARLPIVPVAPTTLQEWAAQEVWSYSVTSGSLSFPMIGRLAELILRVTPTILRALRQTYAFVLLDEFQDTTHVQYDLTHTAFHGSRAVLTAVGDHKQRIMGWAMALDNAFARFECDFGAIREPLLMNYRSAPELVRIQEFMIKALDPAAVQQQVAEAHKEITGSAEVVAFEDQDVEAAYIADEIQQTIGAAGIGPRDMCVLTKQRPEVYAKGLLATLAARGIKARIENDLQDVLAEPATEIILSHLRLATQDRAPKEWVQAVEFACAAESVDPNDPVARRIEQALTAKIKRLRKLLRQYPNSEVALQTVINKALAGIGATALRQAYPQYRHGTFFAETIQKLDGFLWRSVQQEKTWPAALDDFTGLTALPVMTIHKSKGLEYHTVIFLGLEDSAFWTFATQQKEDTCAFFVAFSRAKNRVIFTFANQRTTGPQFPYRQQGAKNIRPLYDILRAAGVNMRRIARPIETT